MEPRLGHDFGRVRIHADRRAADSARSVDSLAYTVGSHVAFADGRYQPATTEGRRLLAHELTHVVQQASPANPRRLARQATDGGDSDEAEAQTSAAEFIIMGGDLATPDSSLTRVPGAVESPAEDGGPAPDDSLTPTGTSSCPVTARFLIMQAGAAKANCQVPQGKVGPSPRLAEFRLDMPARSPPGGQKIDEQFKTLEDPNGIAGFLQPQSNVTDSQGRFDDCYMIATAKPSQYRLKVEQNHLYNGSIISKNQITYTDTDILFCHFGRLPGQCDFGKRCKH